MFLKVAVFEAWLGSRGGDDFQVAEKIMADCTFARRTVTSRHWQLLCDLRYLFGEDDHPALLLFRMLLGCLPEFWPGFNLRPLMNYHELLIKTSTSKGLDLRWFTTKLVAPLWFLCNTCNWFCCFKEFYWTSLHPTRVHVSLLASLAQVWVQRIS